MKPPAVNGRMVLIADLPINSVERPIAQPIIAPMAVVDCSQIAFIRGQPDLMRIAKSPISWGTSWIRMVAVVMRPTVLPAS